MKKSFLRKKSMVAGFTLLFALFGAVAGCKKKAPPPPPPPPTPTPVIPAGSVVYLKRGHLVRMDLESSQTTPLTGGKSTEWFPVCSPKGDQVLYWSNAEGGVYNLWKINLDGSNRTQLTYDETNILKTGDQNLLVNAAAGWSIDGKKIVYAINGDIWQMDPDGYDPETLLTGHEALCPSFSPDGRSVLFISNQGDTVFNIWTVNITDKTVKKITQYTDWNVGSPSYSMDGQKILYNLYRADTTQVYTCSTDGSNPVNLTSNNKSFCPRFAQNDRKIVYCSSGPETEDNGEINVYIMSANGTNPKALTTDGGTSPSWAPAKVLSLLPTPVATVSPKK